MARLIIQTEGVEPGSIDLNFGVTRVGRAPDNQLVLHHPSVSAQHCEVQLGLDSVLIRDCGSTNGTYIDEQRLPAALSVQLAPGQTLRIGDVRAVVEISQETVSVPRIEPPKRPQSRALEPGVMSCERHNGIKALWHCPGCDGRFCGHCIHELRLVRGRLHKLCPTCSTHVDWIDYDKLLKRKKSVWKHMKSFLGGDA